MRKIEPLAFSERTTAIAVLASSLLTTMLAECVYCRRQGDMLLALFLHEAEYHEGEEGENDEARDLEKEDD